MCEKAYKPVTEVILFSSCSRENVRVRYEKFVNTVSDSDKPLVGFSLVGDHDKIIRF